MTHAGQYQTYPPYQPQTTKRNRVHWSWIPITAILAGGMGACTGSLGSAVQRAEQSAAPVVQDVQQEAAPVVEAAGPPDLAQGIPDGQYLVPEEVAPGEYRSAGATEGLFELCSVNTENESGDILDFSSGNAGDQVLITITEEAARVQISGCEPFIKI